MMNISSLNGNWIDLIIVVFLLVYIISSLDKGFIINLIDLLGFIFSFAAALKLYHFAATFLVSNFSLPLGIAKVLGFIILGFTTETLFFILIRLVYKLIPKKITQSSLNKLLGPIPAIVNSLIVIAFFLTIIVATPIQPAIKKAVFDAKIGGLLVTHTETIERELSKIFGEAISDTLQFITISPESSERVNLKFTTAEVTVDRESEEKMLQFINKERVTIGLSSLLSDIKLQEAARKHGQEMFQKGYFSHITPEGLSPFDRMEKLDISFTAAGENLAFAPTVETAHQGLMQSPGHRANILSPDFGKVGIGIIDGGIYGKMFVQEFTN